jgi:hypothetical protein
MRSGLVRRAQLCALGWCTELSYVLWAGAQSSVMCSGLVRRAQLCALDLCAEFGYEQWTSAQNH